MQSLKNTSLRSLLQLYYNHCTFRHYSSSLSRFWCRTSSGNTGCRFLFHRGTNVELTQTAAQDTDMWTVGDVEVLISAAVRLSTSTGARAVQRPAVGGVSCRKLKKM